MLGMIQSRFSCENDCCTLNWTTTLAVSEFIVDKIPLQGEHSSWDHFMDSNLSILEREDFWNMKSGLPNSFRVHSGCLPLAQISPNSTKRCSLIFFFFSFINGHQMFLRGVEKISDLKTDFLMLLRLLLWFPNQPSALIFEQSIERWLGRYVMWEWIYIG